MSELFHRLYVHIFTPFLVFRSSKLLSLDDESGKKLVKVLLFLITEGKISKEEKLIKRIKEDSICT